MTAVPTQFKSGPCKPFHGGNPRLAVVGCSAAAPPAGGSRHRRDAALLSRLTGLAITGGSLAMTLLPGVPFCGGLAIPAILLGSRAERLRRRKGGRRCRDQGFVLGPRGRAAVCSETRRRVPDHRGAPHPRAGKFMDLAFFNSLVRNLRCLRSARGCRARPSTTTTGDISSRRPDPSASTTADTTSRSPPRRLLLRRPPASDSAFGRPGARPSGGIRRVRRRSGGRVRRLARPGQNFDYWHARA